MKTKSLQTVLTITKVLKILTKIAYIFCIVGTVMCLVGGTILVAFEENADNALIAELTRLSADFQGDVRFAYTSVFAAAIVGAFSVYLGIVTYQYLKGILDDGTPFTRRGAKELRNLGIKSLVVPLVASAFIGILYAVMRYEANVYYEFSLANGVAMILLSFVFRYGAELEGEKQPEDEITPEIRN